MSKEYIARILKRYREEKGISVAEVANKFGKSIKTVYSWENGQGQPDADILIKLCLWYGIPSFEILLDEKRNHKTVSEKEELLNAYYKLNSTGRQKAREYISDLSENSKYVKRDKECDIDSIMRKYDYTGSAVAFGGNKLNREEKKLEIIDDILKKLDEI